MNRSVVIIGSGKKVELTAEVLGILNPEADKDTAPARGESPYMGLRYFNTADAGLFYRRGTVSRDLLERVKRKIVRRPRGIHPLVEIVLSGGAGQALHTRCCLV